MAEKEINLETVSLIDLYGANDINAQRIKHLFPKLKIITRGNFLKITGEESEINLFEIFIEFIIQHLNKFNKLTENDIDYIFNEKTSILQKLIPDDEDVLVYGNSGKPVKAKTENQRLMVREFTKNDLVFAIGPAGTGKTYMAISLAVKALKNKEIKRIVLSRPAVEAGEKLGFLPGDMKDKLDPYLQALYDALYEMIPGKKLIDYMEQGIVQIAPLAFMRGRTLSNSVVILDEAQNATTNQLKMFLTRMGENSKFIVTGDITQIDLPYKENSGLIKVNKILKNINGISFVYFDKSDIVRHKLVGSIVDAFEKDENYKNS